MRHCSFPIGLTAYGSNDPCTRQGLLEFGGCFLFAAQDGNILASGSHYSKNRISDAEYPPTSLKFPAY